MDLRGRKKVIPAIRAVGGQSKSSVGKPIGNSSDNGAKNVPESAKENVDSSVGKSGNVRAMSQAVGGQSKSSVGKPIGNSSDNGAKNVPESAKENVDSSGGKSGSVRAMSQAVGGQSKSSVGKPIGNSSDNGAKNVPESAKENVDTSGAMSQEILPPEIQTSFLHLINDCLENIVERLPFEDLIKVSSTCSKMKMISCSVFERKYGNTLIIIFLNPISIIVHEEIFEGTTSIMNILENFGSSIKKLSLNYDSKSHLYDKFVEDVISSSCTDSMTELYISNCHSEMMIGWDKTFFKIKRVKFMYGQLGAEISRIDKYFPEIEHLTLNTVFSGDHFQCHLKALTVLNVYSPMLTTELLVNFISLNPQLQVLKLEHDDNLTLNATFLRVISKKLQSLQVLKLTYPISSWDTVFNDNRKDSDVEFKYLKKIIIRVWDADILQKIPIQFSELLELKIVISINPSRKLFDFLSKALKMDTLTLKIYEENDIRVDSQYMIEFGKRFQNLRNIFLYTSYDITNLHIIRDRDNPLSTNKYLTKNDHKPLLLASHVMSTKYLIRYMAFPIIHVGTTHKMTREFPVTWFGSTDSNGRFAPIGIAMTDDYNFIFNAMRNTVHNFKPEILVFDGSEAIKIAARSVFGNLVWRTELNDNNGLHYFFHSMVRLQSCLADMKPAGMLRELLKHCSQQKMMHSFHDENDL